MQKRRNHFWERDPWPYRESRGPDHYYDHPRDEQREVYHPGDGPPRPYSNREYREPYYEENDRRYEESRPYGYYEDPWPEDEFYRDRGELGYHGNFIERGADRLRSAWHSWTGRDPEYRGPFPEDEPDRYYRRDTHSYNGNRGGSPKRRRHYY